MVYYRTQLAIMFYEEKPKGKTPDPIAEVRITAVSDEKGRYSTEDFERAIYHLMGRILAPQTYWRGRLYKVTAFELDEEIEEDELPLSVPVYKRLNYAERHAVFYRSRREPKDYFRVEVPEYWTKPIAPEPRSGDYVYNEEWIKSQELDLLMRGVIRTYFDNTEGRVRARA